MKKHFYIILFTLILSVSAYSQDRFPDTEILRSDGSGITFKFVTPGYKIKPVNIDGKTYSRFIFENLEYTSEAGYPELPYRTFLIALPPEGEYILTVTDRSTDELKDTHPAPVPGFKKEQDNFPVFEYEVDNEIYRSSKPFKEDLYEVEEISMIGNLRILKLKIYAVQFLPAQDRVNLLKSITIDIRFETPVSAQKSENINNSYLNILNREFVSDFGIKRPDTALSKPVRFEGEWYKIPVSEEGIYKIDIEQAMRMDTLDGIADVGIRIERSVE